MPYPPSTPTAIIKSTKPKNKKTAEANASAVLVMILHPSLAPLVRGAVESLATRLRGSLSAYYNYPTTACGGPPPLTRGGKTGRCVSVGMIHESFVLSLQFLHFFSSKKICSLMLMLIR